jgi:hypothetical protein
MNLEGVHLSILASSPLAVEFFTQPRTPKEIQEEIDSIHGQMEQLDKVILENRTILQLLREHAGRLMAHAENPRIFRVPVLLNNKELHITLDELNLESLAKSLALKDLLKKYKTTKGIFRSHDPEDWKKILVRSSIKAKDHLRGVEIPAVEKRISEVEKKISALEGERFALHEKLKR